MRSMMKRVFTVLLLVCTAASLVRAQTHQDVVKLGEPFVNLQASVGQWRYFLLNVDTLLSNLTSADSITFVASPLFGDVDLFIQTNLFPTQRDCEPGCWASSSAQGDSITIQRSDRRWPTSPAFFYVGVYAARLSSFTFNVWSSRTHAQLLDGIPQVASSRASTSTYFSYTLDQANTNFTITVSPSNGDPDIVASIDNMFPSYDSFTWKSDRYGFDVLPIITSDPSYRSPATYYIGVYGFPDSTFSIVCTKRGNDTIVLEGVPQTQSVDAGEYKYFKFYMLESGIDLSFTVTPLSSFGDPDIFITVNKGHPNASFYDYRATQIGADTVTVSNAQAGEYLIGVLGFTKSDFQLLVNTQYKSVLLSEGSTWRGFLQQGKWAYFKFFHGDSDAGLSISLTANTGDSLMYVSKSNSKPSGDAGKYDYIGTKIGNQNFVYIPPTQVSGNIYVGVYANQNMTYGILAQTNQSLTVLRDGQTAFYNHVSRGYYRYFFFDQTDVKQDVTIAVTPLVGETSLFVSTVFQKPMYSNYTWMSSQYKQDTILVPAGDAKAQGRTRFFIGVYGEQESQFSIVAFLSNSTSIELGDGVPVAGAVSQGKYVYYKFNVKEPGSVVISLDLTDATSMDADLFVSSKTMKPSQLDYDYKGEQYGSDFVRIPNTAPGYLYIGVYGFSARVVSFTISASQENQFISSNRDNVISFTKALKMKQFTTYVDTYCEFVVASTSAIYGRTQMFMNNNDTRVSATDPTSYIWSSRDVPNNLIIVKNTDPHFTPGYWSLGVYGITNADFFTNVICAGQFSYVWLSEGIGRTTAVPTNHTMQFVWLIPFTTEGSISSNYYLYIEPVIGSVDVQVQHDSIPELKWSTNGSQYRMMKFDKSQLKPGFYSVRVTGSSYRPMNNVYQILLSRDGLPVYLNQDQYYIQQATASSQVSYFRVLNSQVEPSPLYLSIESCGDVPAPVGYVDLTNPTPSESSKYKTSLVSKFVSQVTAQPDNNAFYYLGVQGTDFAVSATIRGDAHPLVASKLIMGQDDASINGRLRLRIAKAVPSGLYSDRNITYHVYVSPSNTGNDFNFETACALTTRGRRLYAQAVPTSDAYMIDLIVYHEWDRTTGYRLNVLAQEGAGLGSVYNPVWYVNGQIYGYWPSSGVSIGLILMLLALLGIVFYLIGGSIINVMRGKRGVEVIPNLAFWKMLPIYVWDGITGVFCCRLCKKREGEFEQLQEETSADASSSVNASSSSTSAQTGYGTV